MLARLRARLTYANVVATLALFLALGGVSYAAIRVGSASIVNNSVRTQDLRNNDIRSKDIRNRTITNRDILTNTVTGQQVRESSLTKVPDADSLDGQDSASFRVGCPGGTARHGDACIETSGRSAATYLAASRTCATSGRRLPTYGELESYRQEPGVTIGAPGQPELTGDLLSVNGAGSGEAAAIFDNGSNDVVSISGESVRFRCVAPLSN